MNLSQETIKKLIDAAHQARENAYIPYSSYKVGAAVLTANDQIITGANVKGGSFNLICCGERMALLKALFDGHRKFKAVVTVTSNGATPCGSCRQVIYELCNDAHVIVANTEGSYKIYKASELLPHAFEDSKTKKKN